MKKKLTRFLVVLAAMTMMIGMMSMTTFAKTKTIKPKYQKYTSKVSDIKKTTTVKKGTYKVVIPKKERCFLKFTAPSTKTYTFKINGVTPKAGDNYANGYYYVMTSSKYSAAYLNSNTVKTEGGKASSLFFNSKADGRKVTSSAFIPSRSAKIKLQAGTTVYVYISSGADHLTFSVK